MEFDFKPMKNPESCLYCGSRDIVWDDYGYVKNNCAEAKCGKCGFVLKISGLPWQAEAGVRKAWNGQRRKARVELSLLRKELALLHRRVRKLENLLAKKG